MNALVSDLAIRLSASAKVELEQRLLGWMLQDAPGAIAFGACMLRTQAALFDKPHDAILAGILELCDSDRVVTPRSVAASLAGNPGLKELGFEYLENLADSAPPLVSADDAETRMDRALKSWRALMGNRAAAGTVGVVRADTVKATNISWLWPGWLAEGKVHLLAGSPGTGKTTLSLAIAAAITRGGTFPGGARAERGSVLMWSGEDDLADSILPRFKACGGDDTRLHFVRDYRDQDGTAVPFDPSQDLPALADTAMTMEDLRLLILDPVVSAIAGDSHKNTETRRALQPLVRLAERQRIAVLGITHFSKGSGGRDPVERVTGSLAFTAVSRLVMVTAKPKDGGENRRLVRAKSNIGPDGGGFEYALERVLLSEGSDVSGQRVAWGEAIDGTAQELLSEVEMPEDASPSKTASAGAWLLAMLGDGQADVRFLRSVCGQAGHTWATVRRARTALKAQGTEIEAVKSRLPNGGWAWRAAKERKDIEGASPENA
jgi:hypothetical protein